MLTIAAVLCHRYSHLYRVIAALPERGAANWRPSRKFQHGPVKSIAIIWLKVDSPSQRLAGDYCRPGKQRTIEKSIAQNNARRRHHGYRPVAATVRPG
jgi:hypothetical protein